MKMIQRANVNGDRWIEITHRKVTLTGGWYGFRSVWKRYWDCSKNGLLNRSWSNWSGDRFNSWW